MFICEFCGIEFEYEGIDDLLPLCDEGYCCETCYDHFVMPAKLMELRAKEKELMEDESEDELYGETLYGETYNEREWY